ncbi:MAG TPA: hypothetical protein VIH35_08940, partial [Kiritimatiellia bacterium]
DLRVVAYARQQVRHQSFARTGFEVGNHGRSCTLIGVPTNGEVDLDHAMRLNVRPEGLPKEIAVVCQERVLARMAYSVTHLITIDPALIGEGPNQLQAVALYPDNEAVRSWPVSIRVARSNKPPDIGNIGRDRDTNGVVFLAAESTDPEGDDVRTAWLQALALPEPGQLASEFGRVLGGTMGKDTDFPYLKANTTTAVCIFPETDALRELTARMSVPPDAPPMKDQLGGLAFNFKDEKNFSFFGLSSDASAWMLGRYENGVFVRIAAYGAYLVPNTWYRIGVRQSVRGGVEAVVDGDVVARWAEGQLSGGDFGVMAGVASAHFKDVAASPPMYPKNSLRVEGERLLVLDEKAAEDRAVTVRCSDKSRSLEKIVVLNGASPATGGQ